MKLLLITQKIDEADPILGFMIGWIKSLANKSDFITVICLEKGAFALPHNVKVLSLGKESGRSRFKYLWNFYRIIWRERNQYEAVFVHMNQIYVILGGLFWRWFQKPVALWYAHGSISWSLRLAHKIANLILTSSPAGFRLPSKKKRVIGQGIDVQYFSPEPHGQRNKKKLINVGRISKVKKQLELIIAVNLINDKDYHLKLIGAPITNEDQIYFDQLKKTIDQTRLSYQINLAGPVKPRDLLPHLREASLFVTMSQTGSFDKAVLEAMATGLIPIVANPTFGDLLGDLSPQLIIKPDSQDLAAKILAISSLNESELENLRVKVRDIIVQNHSLDNLTTKIVTEINQCLTT